MTNRPRLTIISDEISQDLAEVTQFVREFRLPGIELRSIFGRAFKDLSSADVATIAKTATDEGWRVFGCATPVFKCDLDDAAAIREHLDIFRRSLDVACRLGSDFVRVFTFLRQSSAAGNRAALPRVAEHLAQLVEIARGMPVRIGVENELSCIVATTEELTPVFSKLDQPAIGIVWDPCNILYLPDEPPPAWDGFAALASRVIHVHVKDAVRRTRPGAALRATSVPVGLGDVGWRSHLPEILRCGYEGLFSLETHWRVTELAEEELHLPSGHAFSHGGAEASRVCLHNLVALLEAQSWQPADRAVR